MDRSLPTQRDRSGSSVTASTIASATDRLRGDLRGHHLRTESRLRLPESVSTTADYALLLDLWTAAWAAVASQADESSLPGCELIALSTRAHVLLAADRRELPPRSSATFAPVEFDVAADAASRWGVVYVLKGSSLGNRVLRPLILGRLGGARASAFRYLTGSGGEVRRDWREFCARLDQSLAGAPDEHLQRMVAAGAATFALVAAAADAVGWPVSPHIDSVGDPS